MGKKLLEDDGALVGGALEEGNRGAGLLGSASGGEALEPKMKGVALEVEGFGGAADRGWHGGTDVNEVAEVEG